jgi:hypothetical protein
MMRDKIAEIIKNIKDVESRPDYTMPYQVADHILALEVPGKVVSKSFKELYGCEECACTKCAMKCWEEGCFKYEERPAQIADLIKGEE